MSEGKPLSLGCLFCKSGREAFVARQFERSFPSARAIVPTNSRLRRTKADALEERETLLPGYVFFEVCDPPHQPVESAEARSRLEHELRLFSRQDDVFRLLCYSGGGWRLHGADDRFARMLFDAGGNIGLSQAWFDEGDRIRILSGFLKDYEGSITRVNRKRRTVEVSVDFQEKKMTLWLGYELVTNVEAGS